MVDNNKSYYAYVIPDREVWVKHEGSQIRAMVPAILLCMTEAEEWTAMVKKSRGCEEYLDPEDVGAAGSTY